jgi:glycopeptide antibiotics resistance protein
MRTVAGVVPLFLPGVVLSVVLGLLLARSIARALGTRSWVAFLLVVGTGTFLSATLTPVVGALEDGAASSGTCDLSAGLSPLSSYLRINEASGNVALCMPLGFALGLLPWDRRTLPIILGAFALPALVEATQMLVPALGRGCESRDVINNMLGIGLGMLVGVVGSGAVALIGRVARSDG